MAVVHGLRDGNTIKVQERIRFTEPILFDQNYLLGDTYYVRNDGTDSTARSGMTVDECWKTLAYAVSKAGNWDRIIVLPATDCSAYLETELPINITQTGLKILGLLSHERQWGSPAIHTHGTTTMITVNAHQVEIGNLAFHDQGAGVSIDWGTTNNYWRGHLHDCYFGGNSTALTAVIWGNTTAAGVGSGATIDSPCGCIERCFFMDYVTRDIFWNTGYGSVIRNCTFAITASAGIGIEYYTDGTSRPHSFIFDNRFSAVDSTNAYGIKVTNTPTAGYLMIDGNSFNNFADAAHCLSKHDGYLGANYCNGILITT